MVKTALISSNPTAHNTENPLTARVTSFYVSQNPGNGTSIPSPGLHFYYLVALQILLRSNKRFLSSVIFSIFSSEEDEAI